MTRKTPSDFTRHEDWLSYVHSEIAVSDQPYALSIGRMELLRSLYGMQNIPLSFAIGRELERIEVLQDPERTAALEKANDEMFRSLTENLLDRARQTLSEDYAQRTASPQELIQELLRHLAQKNPYFALWVAYKRCLSDYSVAESWDEYLLQELGIENEEEIAFAHAMAKLDKLLALFHGKKLSLPGLSFERIWFLDSILGPERMLQTRAVLGMLTAELATCTSA